MNLSTIWSKYGVHAFSYIGNALLLASGFAGTYGAAVPKWGPIIVGAAGIVSTFVHNMQTLLKSTPILPAPAPTAVSKQSGRATIRALVEVLTVGALIALLLPGCATTPNATQQAGIAVLVDAATGVVVQKGTTDPAVWASRAKQITAIAGQLEALDTGSATTLPALTQAINQVIAKAHLGPADLLAANTFVATLEQLVTAQVKANPSTSATQATVLMVLQDVISAAAVYEVPAG